MQDKYKRIIGKKPNEVSKSKVVRPTQTGVYRKKQILKNNVESSSKKGRKLTYIKRVESSSKKGRNFIYIKYIKDDKPAVKNVVKNESRNNRTGYYWINNKLYYNGVLVAPGTRL